MNNSIYKLRRDELIKVIPKNSILLIPGADMQYRNADSAYPFRQDSDFYYFSGFGMNFFSCWIFSSLNTILR